MQHKMKLKELKKGDYFKRKATDSIVYVKGDYIRYIKKYVCYKFDDINSGVCLKGATEVITDFTF